ncbi:uncharacterized protein LOC119192499, partial [Manduca sexta]|uniref:uncharacterized protein LOC119192499 n=1 Tax=Manduca sexta TaxID=7130 RepID=UPI0018907316
PTCAVKREPEIITWRVASPLTRSSAAQTPRRDRAHSRGSGRAEAATHPALAAVTPPARRGTPPRSAARTAAPRRHSAAAAVPRAATPPRCAQSACARRPATQFIAATRDGHTCVSHDKARRLKRSNAPTNFFITSDREGDLSLADKIASQVEMPTSLFGDLGGGGGGLVEDQRAFQLALELSMLSLGESLPATNPLASPLGFAPPPDDRAKKSQNMTECVPVPSSEHVAEIVGRQGTPSVSPEPAGGPPRLALCRRLEVMRCRRSGERRHPYVRAHVPRLLGFRLCSIRANPSGVCSLAAVGL